MALLSACVCRADDYNGAARHPPSGLREHQLRVADADAYAVARRELPLQDLLRQRVLDMLLDGALQRPRPVHRVEARLPQQIAGPLVEPDVHVAFLPSLARL